MHLCICVHCLCACASFSVCMHMHVCVCVCVYVDCQTWGAGRGRSWMVGGDVYLFITQWPSVVSGGHGNTCPGPFSTGLFVACFGLAKAFSSQLLGSVLSSIPSIYSSFAFGSCLGCTFYRSVQYYLFFFGSYFISDRLFTFPCLFLQTLVCGRPRYAACMLAVSICH